MTPDSAPAAVDPARNAHVAKSEKLHDQLLEGIKTIVSAVGIAVVLRSFLFEPFNIPSASMLPKLEVGDYLFVAKWPYGYSRYSFPFGPALFQGRIGGSEPDRGDVIVFRNPNNTSQDFIKRLVGMPGDQIRMEGGVLHINGRAIPKVRVADAIVPVTRDEDCRALPASTTVREATPGGGEQCRYRQFSETLPSGRSYLVLDQSDSSDGDNTPTFIVPAGQYFMMGDNRDDSADSRFGAELGGVGYVPSENLVGRATVMWFSIDGTAHWYAPWTWPGAIRFSRIGTLF